MARGTNGRTPPRDNYIEFLERLDAAAASLIERRESQDMTLEIVNLLYEQNAMGLRLWEDRLSKVERALSGCSDHSGKAKTLGDLRDVAQKMEPMFRTRTERARHRLEELRGRRAEITNSLTELEESKIKLTSSRMLAQEHENLSKAVADLAGTPDGAISVLPDLGLREDLKHAREAVILAEALMEVKGQ
jgi:predicted  nucleic acid-binding Zn-ribbon protein